MEQNEEENAKKEEKEDIFTISYQLQETDMALKNLLEIYLI